MTVYSSVILPLILVNSVCTAQYILMYHWYFCLVFTYELHFITEMKCTLRIVLGQISGFDFWQSDSTTTAQKYSLCSWPSFAISAYCVSRSLKTVQRVDDGLALQLGSSHRHPRGIIQVIFSRLNYTLESVNGFSWHVSKALQVSQMLLVSIFCIFVTWEQVTLTHFPFVCFGKYQTISGILWVWPGETRNVGMGRLSSRTVSAEADWACSQHFLIDT